MLIRDTVWWPNKGFRRYWSCFKRKMSRMAHRLKNFDHQLWLPLSFYQFASVMFKNGPLFILLNEFWKYNSDIWYPTKHKTLFHSYSVIIWNCITWARMTYVFNETWTFWVLLVKNKLWRLIILKFHIPWSPKNEGLAQKCQFFAQSLVAPVLKYMTSKIKNDFFLRLQNPSFKSHEILKLIKNEILCF